MSVIPSDTNNHISLDIKADTDRAVVCLLLGTDVVGPGGLLGLEEQRNTVGVQEQLLLVLLGVNPDCLHGKLEHVLL